jgi:Uma2 family endonuclease
MTAEELFRLPDDGEHYELVKGELRKMAPTGDEHAAIVPNISSPLHQYVKANKLGVVYSGEPGYIIATNPDTVRAPDVAFVRQERIEATGGLIKTYRPGAPDLAVEVISPNDLYTEVEEKVEEWLLAGTRLVWVVDPRRRIITVHQPDHPPIKLTIADQLDGGDVVPGWTFPVREVFS